MLKCEQILHKFRDAGETVNDANDRAIVKCASFFKQALGNNGEVLFVTSDVGNKVRECSDSFTITLFTPKHRKEPSPRD
jgi:hypothetical protein